MSLIYQGNTIENFGKYLPVPYIERIHLETRGHGDAEVAKCTISACVYLKVNEEEDIDAVLTRLNDEIVFYFLFAANTSGGSNAATEARSVINQENNIFSYYDKFKEGAPRDRGLSMDVYLNSLSFSDFAEDTRTGRESKYPPSEIFYDENGDKVYKFPVTVTRALELGGSSADPWDNVHNLQVFAFSSTFDYYDQSIDTLSSELENIEFFDRRTSDIAYEVIFADGELVDPFEMEFFDADGVMYNKAPLQTIDGRYHKADTITHERIVGYFNNLLAQFTVEDSLLKKMKTNIAYIIGTHAKEADLLYQLNVLRKAFPNKSIATPVGQLYARFKKRIFTTNKDVKSNALLSPKIIRNPKLFDERSVPVYTPQEPIHKELYDNKNYLYSHGCVGRTALYSFPGEYSLQESEAVDYEGNVIDIDANNMTEAAWENPRLFDAIVRNSGYFFFDYEKALRRVANINKAIDVGKMMRLGIPTDYKHFRVTSVSATRPEDAQRDPDSQGRGQVKITAHMNPRKSYPVTSQTTTDDGGTAGRVLISPGFYSNPEASGPYKLTQEEHPYVMIRNFEPVQKRSFSGRIQNYRLMCFEFQDFMDDDLSAPGLRSQLDIDYYKITVEIEDNSMEFLREFIEKYKNALLKLIEYRNLAEEMFSYDESTGLFNDFFIEGIHALYVDNEARAPWNSAPVVYNMHRDLLYNTFGGRIDKIIEDAQSTMSNINPFNGTFWALNKLVNEMETFFKDNFERTTDIGGLLGAPTETKTFNNKLTYDSAGNVDEPYGVIYSDSGETHDLIEEEEEEEEEEFVTFAITETGALWIDRLGGWDLGIFDKHYRVYTLTYSAYGAMETKTGVYDSGAAAPWLDGSFTTGTSGRDDDMVRITFKSKVEIPYEDPKIEDRTVYADRGGINLTEIQADYPESYGPGG